MIYGSICSGIEAASVAWHPLGWRPSFFAEIDKFPSAVLAHHYPQVPNLGDFTKICPEHHEAIDLLVGGTPCQSFSIAGLRGGLADVRGNLALEYLRLADRARPRWLVWENVPGVLSSNGGRDFGAILGGMVELGYGVAYRVLDAQFIRVDGFRRAVPQRRRRVIAVGYLGDWRRAAAVLFERASLLGHPAPGRAAREGTAYDVAPCLATSGRGFERAGDTRGQDCLVAFGGNDTSGPIDVATARNAHAGPHDTANIRAASGGSSRSYVAQTWAVVRRLTPTECERLQGFPDSYTDVPWRKKNWTPDGPRYKALGNSMAVNVMRWVGQRIQMVEAMEICRVG